MSITIMSELLPGDFGYIMYLHGKICAEEYEFDTTFEPYVARPLIDFRLAEDQTRQNIWIVELDDKIVGSIANVDAGNNDPQLRWLLLTKRQGAWRARKEKEYRNVYLWTIDALHAARILYRGMASF
jgi:hypothetical protein